MRLSELSNLQIIHQHVNIFSAVTLAFPEKHPSPLGQYPCYRANLNLRRNLFKRLHNLSGLHFCTFSYIISKMKINTEQKFMKSAGGCKPLLFYIYYLLPKLGFTAQFRCILFSLKDVACCGMICWIAQVASRVAKRNLQLYDLSTWVVIHNICPFASILLFSQNGRSFFFPFMNSLTTQSCVFMEVYPNLLNTGLKEHGL